MKMINALIVWGSVVLMAMVWTGACSPTEDYRSTHQSLPEASDMKDQLPTAMMPAAIPPIDAAAPQAFDTATFALG